MMFLPKQLVGIIKRVKSKGLINVTKEILVYFRKFKDSLNDSIKGLALLDGYSE